MSGESQRTRMRMRRTAALLLLGFVIGGASPIPQSAQAGQSAAEVAELAALRDLVNVTTTDLASRQVDTGCKKGDDIRSSDLCAQWKAADAAREAAFWAQKSYNVSFWGTLGVLGTLLLALWSNRIALKALDVENRPWLDVEAIKFDPFMRIDNDPTEVVCFGRVFLKNTGKTVAAQPVIRWWTEENFNAFNSIRYWKRGSAAIGLQDIPPLLTRDGKIHISLPIPAEKEYFTVRNLAIEVAYSSPGQWRKRRIRQVWAIAETVFQNTAQPMPVSIIDRNVAPIAHHQYTFQIT